MPSSPEKRKEYREKNKEKIAKQKAEYYRKNIEARKAYDREYNRKNAELRAAKARKYYAANKEKVKERNKRYRKDNLSHILHLNRMYEARKLNQQCTCCTKAELQKWYDERPEGYHVDHKKPLSLGGLHCCKNLQYLTAKENLSKRNRWIDE